MSSTYIKYYNQIIQLSHIINKIMSTPPWVKNNNNNTNNQPPPWVKNNNTNNTVNTPVNNTPPWVKNNTNNSPSVQVEKTTEVDKPISQSNNQTQNTNNNPPWVKNISNNNSTPGQINSMYLPNKQTQVKQPPWVKNNNTTNTSNMPNKEPQVKLAPWAKQNNNPSNNTVTQSKTTNPPWMNKNITPQSPSSNQNVPQTIDKQPPWLKKQSSGSQNNLYKIQQTQQIQKKKRQLEQTIKRQQQQEKQKKRLQKIKKQKERQQQDIKRQLEEMAKQQQISILRQKQDKQQFQKTIIQQNERKERQKRQEQQRIKRQQERLLLQRLQRQQKEKLQRQKEQQDILSKETSLKLNETQKKTKSKSKSFRKSKKQVQQQHQSSKISHISSIKLLDIQMPTQRSKQIPQNQNLFHKYNRLLSQQIHQSSYKNKIQLQKQIIQLQLKFKSQSINQILSLIQKKKITNRKRKFILSNNLQIKYGLCQGKKKDNKISFINDQCDELKQKFMSYEVLNKCINGLLKKKMNIHLRIPLLNLAEYKGIVFLIEYICQELIDMVQTDISLYQQITNQVLIIQKELEMYYQQSLIRPITKGDMLVKKINIYGDDYYIIYLKDKEKDGKDHVNKSKKKINLSNYLNQISFLQLITTPSSILPYYQHLITIDQKIIENYDKMGSHLKTIAQSIQLASSINTVYSSCQGQVNQSSFFQLIFDQNKQIWQMIANTEYYKQSDSPLPLALSYLEKIGSIKFNITTQSSASQKGKKRQLVKSITPRVYIQRLDFQFLQFIKNIQKYLKQGKQQLIQLSMSMSHALWQKLHQQSQLNFIQIRNEVSYLLYKRQNQKALQYLLLNKGKLSQLDIRNISILLLEIRIYIILDKELKIINTLTELIKLLEFYFKNQTIIHSYIYTIVGTYYSKQIIEQKEGQANNNDRQKNVIIFYEHAVNIALKLYGQKSYQVAQIYLNRANAFYNLKKYDLFHKDINQALKLFKIHSKSASKIAQCLYLQGKVLCSQKKFKQGLENMQNSIQTFLKLQNYIQTINISFSMLQFLQQNQPQYDLNLQRIVQICLTYKCIWAFKKIITIILDRQLNCYSSLTINNIQSIVIESQQQYRTNQQIIIDIQNYTKGFSSFIQILRWSLSILAAKMIVRRQNSVDYQKAFNIIKNVFHFYVKDKNLSTFSLKQSYLI